MEYCGTDGINKSFQSSGCKNRARFASFHREIRPSHFCSQFNLVGESESPQSQSHRFEKHSVNTSREENKHSPTIVEKCEWDTRNKILWETKDKNKLNSKNQHVSSYHSDNALHSSNIT